MWIVVTCRYGLTRGQRTVNSVGNVLYIDLCGSYMGVCVYKNSLRVHLRFVHFNMFKLNLNLKK